MTATEFAAAQAETGWKDAELARRLGKSKQFIAQMRNAVRPVPEGVAAYLDAALAALRAIPSPTKDPA